MRAVAWTRLAAGSYARGAVVGSLGPSQRITREPDNRYPDRPWLLVSGVDHSSRHHTLRLAKRAADEAAS